MRYILSIELNKDTYFIRTYEIVDRFGQSKERYKLVKTIEQAELLANGHAVNIAKVLEKHVSKLKLIKAA